MVGCGVVLLALPTNTRHPNEVWVLGQQIHDVAVGKLCGITRGLGWHGLDAHVIRFCGGLIGQNDREAQLSEKRVPERIVLVHVQRARNAHGAARCLVYRKRLAIKQQLILERKDVWGFILLSTTLLTCAFLATVTGDKPVAAAKVVDGKHAAVRADAAVRVGKLDLQVVDRLAVKQGGYAVNTCAVAGEKSGAVGTHNACNVRTDDISAGEQLKSTERCIGHESAALNNAVLTNLAEVAKLDDLEQGVLDNGV